MVYQNRIIGLVYFFIGIIVAYFTYPFFSNLVTGFTSTSAEMGLGGWATVQVILWVGYAISLLNWIIVLPTITILRNTPQNPFKIFAQIGYFIFFVGFVYISYPVLTVLLPILDTTISGVQDWDNFLWIFWAFYVGIMVYLSVGMPLYKALQDETPDQGGMLE